MWVYERLHDHYPSSAFNIWCILLPWIFSHPYSFFRTIMVILNKWILIGAPFVYFVWKWHPQSISQSPADESGLWWPVRRFPQTEKRWDQPLERMEDLVARPRSVLPSISGSAFSPKKTLWERLKQAKWVKTFRPQLVVLWGWKQSPYFKSLFKRLYSKGNSRKMSIGYGSKLIEIFFTGEIYGIGGLRAFKYSYSQVPVASTAHFVIFYIGCL